jgi:hypothetical protein
MPIVVLKTKSQRKLLIVLRRIDRPIEIPLTTAWLEAIHDNFSTVAL